MKPKSSEHYHLVGVGGVGMNAVAQILLAQGYLVSGSDRYLDSGQNLEVLQKLRVNGVRLVPQDGSGISIKTSGVIVSTAIEPDNPDIAEARSKNVPVIHRSQMLARMVEGHRLVAITGTSGKTTVTGMVGWLLERLNLDPSVVNGGVLLNWRHGHRIGNVRGGQSDLWVLEVDESDRSLLNFTPDWAVITNISKDHFELDEVTRLFQQFAEKVKTGIVCGSGVGNLLHVPVKIVEEPFELRLQNGVSTFVYKDHVFEVPLIGKHNAENAFAAVVLCDQLGCDLGAVKSALHAFKGISRRLERVGELGGVTVFDDYAHNPAKIRATWQAVAGQYPRVLGIWRPHGFGPLNLMMEDLVRTFREVCRPDDRVFLLPVYYAGGTASRSVSANDLVQKLRQNNVIAEVTETYDDLKIRLLAEAGPGDAVVFMGARDPEMPVFARSLSGCFPQA